MITSQFVFDIEFDYRRGCAFGIAQSHIIGTGTCRLGKLDSFEDFAKVLQSLTENEDLDFPKASDIASIVGWIARATGAILRSAKIATTRKFYFIQLSADQVGNYKFQLALPVKAAAASIEVLRWIVTTVNQQHETNNTIQDQFFALIDRLSLFSDPGLNQWRLMQAAYDEDFSVRTIATGIICVGVGINRRWFRSFITDKTPSLSVRVAQSKFHTAQLLRAYGFPGAENILVNNLGAAIATAKEMGYPIVVKPNDRDRGEGVSANIVNEHELVHAYKSASQLSREILIEKFQAGFTHRLTVIEGTVIRVAKHVAMGVIGDGVSTIAQLVEKRVASLEERLRVLRSPSAACHLDEEAVSLLNQYSLSPSCVLPAGKYIKLRSRDNVSAGGTRYTLDTEKDVHPDNIELALDVCRLLRLDFGGVDFITEDIGKSWREVQSTICEINANPQLVARDDPDMYKKVLRRVVPDSGHVSTSIIVFDTSPSSQQFKDLVATFSPKGSKSGLSFTSGNWVGGRRIGSHFPDSFSAAEALLSGTDSTNLTFVMSLKEILDFGLPMNRVDNLILPWKEDIFVPKDKRAMVNALLSASKAHIGNILAF